MRIIIVEDEPNIRNGIVNIINENTSHKIIGALDCAENALDVILKDPPDLIITDIRMGNMDGLTMIKKLRESFIKSDVVVLTGFSSFDYAREAINLNVKEYLLKPITVEDLLNCINRIEKENEIQKYELSPEQLFVMKLSGNIKDNDKFKREIQRIYGISSNSEYLLAVFQLKSIDRQSFYWTLHKIYEKLSILCIETAVVTRIFSEQKIILIIFQSEKNKNLEMILQKYILSDILQEVLCICSCDRYKDIDYIQNQVEVCSERIMYSLFLPQNTVITPENIKIFPCQKIQDVSELKKGMKNAILNDNLDKLQEYAKEYNQKIFKSIYSPQDIIDITSEFLCNICMYAQDKIVQLKDFFNYKTMISEISNILTLQELSEYFDRKIMEIVNCKLQENKPCENIVISNVISYIQKHYMEDIPLPVLAEQMCLTPEYLSNLFTKEMGVNFSSFLKNFRISNAKRLLQDNKLKINEIALQVGFRDPKYFNRVFKEVNGVSPSEYRASLYR